MNGIPMLAAFAAALLASCGSGAADRDTPATVVTTAPAEAAPTTTTPVVDPDCTGGTAILETTVGIARLAVVEAPDGRAFCIEDQLYGGDFGNIPDRPADTVELIKTGNYGRAWYEFNVPVSFPAVVTVRAEDGTELPVARGRDSYLVVIDPEVGRTPNGPVTYEPRTLEVINAEGVAFAQLEFDGIAKGAFATFEEFLNCARDHDVDMQIPAAPDETVPTRRPTPGVVLQLAWQACADVLYSYLEGNSQGRADYLRNSRFRADCLTNAGFYPSLGEEIVDQDAFELVSAQCDAFSPGRVALVDCMRVHGLELIADGAVNGGPFQPDEATVAWQACRDTFAQWEVSSAEFVADVLEPFDCMAAAGWIVAVMSPPADSDAPELQAARRTCD